MEKLSWLILLLGLLGSFAYAELRESGGDGIDFSSQISVPGDTANRLYRSGAALYFGATLISSGS